MLFCQTVWSPNIYTDTAVKVAQSMSTHEQRKDWLTWAESYLTDWKIHDAQLRKEWGKAFSPQFEKIFELAKQTAVNSRHDVVGAEHLLAALLELNRGSASDALNGAGLALPVLHAEIKEARGVGTSDSRDLPWTPRASWIIWRSRDHAQAAGRVQVEPEDILLGILGEDQGLPAQIFRKRGIDPEKIRSAVLAKTSHP
jgi:ATP-dependent Clp protease ATP-binding subunit ClpA